MPLQQKEAQKGFIDTLREKQIAAVKWGYLGEGSFNEVYYNTENNVPIVDDDGECEEYQGPWVKKKANRKHALTDVERQSRLFKTIEAEQPFRQHNDMLFMPYYSIGEGWRNASDNERAEKCLHIYRTTGRILLDAMLADNIKSHDGKVVCVDIDLALRPDSPLGRQGFFSMGGQYGKEERMTWHQALREFHLLQEKYNAYYYPNTHLVLRGLVDLAEHFGKDEVPEDLLTLDVMRALDKVRSNHEEMESFITALIEGEVGLIPGAT